MRANPGLVAFLTGILVLCSCGENRTHVPEPPASPYLANTSIDNVITNLTTAITRAEIQPYAALLADEFEFVFDSADVERIGTPRTWSREDELFAMGRILADSTNVDGYVVCDTIRLSFDPLDRDSVSTPGLTRVTLWAEMEVPTRRRAGQDQLWYYAESVKEHLYLRRTGSAWALVRWEEESAWSGAGFSVWGTVGWIKWHWRRT